MKNTSFTNTLCPPRSPEVLKTAEGIKKALIRLFFDYSTSMSRNKKAVYDAAVSTLERLAKENEQAIDCEFVAQIIFLGDEVKFFNDQPLDPGQLLELFSDDDYVLKGSTEINKWVDFFDKDYSRSSGFLDSLNSYGYKCYNLIFTDFVGTDDADVRSRSLEVLKSNAFYPKYSTTLCVFFGPENKKEEAAVIAGSEENVIAVTPDLFQFLTPTIIGSSVMLINSTHVNNGSTSETAKHTLENIKNGQEGANNAKMSADEIAKAMEDLMKGLA